MPTINRTKTAIIAANISEVARNKEIRAGITFRYSNGTMNYLGHNEELIPCEAFENKFPIDIVHINANNRLDSRQI